MLAIAGIEPDHDLNLMTANQSLDELTARALTGIGQVLDKERPDWVVVQGDTTSVLAGALAAHYRKIRVCHVEAGLRSGDLNHPWPEEANRKMVGAIARLHCAPTQASADALLGENVSPASIHVTGNTVIDALNWVTECIGQDPSIAAGLSGLEARFADRRIIGVTSHRRENLGDSMLNIAKSVKATASLDDVAVISPVHPNPSVRSVMERELSDLDNVALIEPLDYPHFARLLAISHVILTDSGGVQEEAPALGKPVLVMRKTTEQPEGVAVGTARLVGTDTDTIVRETERLLDDETAYAAMACAQSLWRWDVGGEDLRPAGCKLRLQTPWYSRYHFTNCGMPCSMLVVGW